MLRASGASSIPPPSRWLLDHPLARVMTLRRVARSLRGAQLRAHLLDQLLGGTAFEPRDVVLVLEQHAERVGDGGRIERDRVELGERARPVESLGDAGGLEQILLAQRLDEV